MFKSAEFIFLWMLFMHIVDDYYLQGILAKMKQKTWWRSQIEYKDLYKNDYKVALLCHSFSWAFMTMLPLAVFDYHWWLIYFIAVNTIIHYIVDDLKANKLKINLATDQSIHFYQLCVSWIFYMVIRGAGAC